MSTFVRPKWTGFGRAVLAGALVALFGAPTGASGQDLVAEKYEQHRQRQMQAQNVRVSLHASPTVVLNANQFQCGLRSQGDTCSDIFNSPTGGGGFWPTGSPNQYMFNSGIQIAGIIPEDAGFAWAGDTTGAYFMDARGTQQHGTPITNIYNSLDADDFANWPEEGSVPGFPFATAYIRDTEIFNPVLVDRKAGSQQDSWVMYWDGDPALSANRAHPMGITIEQRTMAWNFPSGNEATIYLFYKITNVTNNETFQALNEARYNIELPDGGWRYEQVYLAYDADADVTTDAGQNFASAVLPFNMGITWQASFEAAEFSYPPSLFYPPFFTSAPGIIGTQYLKSPVDPATGQEVGLTLFSVHTNTACTVGFCDPVGDRQLWRYISGNASPGLGDPACAYPNPKESRLCYLAQSPLDVRSFQASGPFELGPGESTTIVVAMMAAATVSTDLITIGSNNPPGSPTVQPGCFGNPILPIEVGAGWVSPTPTALCTETEEGQPLNLREVVTVPMSLLNRAQVAQAVFDGQFLLPFAPEPPPFYLVAGDGQIAVVWEPSTSETIGDPFFETASQEFTPTGDPNPLYNQNYRQFDVEGYRVYRSSDNSNFQLVAQFDYGSTTFTDFRCEADREFVPGEDDGADCVATEYAINDITDIDHDFVNDPFVLFGGVSAQRLRLADGRTLAIQGDSASPGTTPDLTDTGVPFVYIDTDVRNGFRYYYQVKAFDINSTFSGPISLESSSATKNSIPRRSTIDPASAQFEVALLDASGEPLETGLTATIDPATGMFTGPMPPTDAFEVNFLPFAPDLLAQGSFELRMDSVQTAYYGGTYFFTGPDGASYSIPGMVPNAENIRTETLGPWSIPADAALAELQRNAGGDPPPNAGAFSVDVTMERPQWHSGQIDWTALAAVAGFWPSAGRPGPAAVAGGSRWFVGENESTPDPTLGTAAGAIPGVTVFKPMPFYGMANYVIPGGATISQALFRRFYQSVWAAVRQADIEVTWGAGGEVASVVDVTHGVPVPFHTHTRASYGFLTDADGDGMLTYGDFYYIPGQETAGNTGFISAGMPVQLVDQPVFMSTDTDGDMVANGTGFGMYIGGEPYLFGTTAPAAGEVWTLRSHFGRVTQAADGTYSFAPTTSNPAIPGLRVAVTVTAAASFDAASVDLRRVHTVPDPYYVQSAFDLSPIEKALRFVNLPPQATVRIYSVSGLLVDVVTHADPAGGGMATWDLKNRSGQFVASGVYFYHVSTPNGQEHIGRFTVINSGIGQ